MMNSAAFPQHVLVTGGTGFIGRHLVAACVEKGATVTVLSRSEHASGDKVRFIRSLDDFAAPDAAYSVVNLAGEPLNSGRWNAKLKAEFRRSRIDMTEQLVQWINRQTRAPDALLSGSAVGWYGHRGDELLTEVSEPGSGFSHQLCADWERAAKTDLREETRCCIVRIGVVLGTEGGSLPEMLTPAKLGLGGPMGSGQQWWSWIHIDDLVAMMLWLLEYPSYSGVFNGTAPNPMRQRDIASTLGDVINRPAFMPLPGFMARLMLGEFADEILLQGQRVEPARVQAMGFEFSHPTLEGALQDLLQ